MRESRTSAFALLALLSAASVAAGPATSDLSWLAGNWCSADGSRGYEETWLAPRGGSMIGMAREFRGDHMVSFEFLRIADVEGVPTYHAQPGGRAPTLFKRGDGGEQWVRFENSAHDFPQRIEYRRDGDKLDAEISGPGKDGKTVKVPYELVRCPD